MVHWNILNVQNPVCFCFLKQADFSEHPLNYSYLNYEGLHEMLLHPYLFKTIWAEITPLTPQK